MNVSGSGAAKALLLALTAMFALSQAFRTLPALLGGDLELYFRWEPRDLATMSALFQLAFAVFQLPAGVAIDTLGVRATALLFFPVAVAGGLVCAGGFSPQAMMVGQILLGAGCAPAFLACNVLISRRFPANRFSELSGLAMGGGKLGLLMTGTPLALVVVSYGWQAAYGLLVLLVVGIVLTASVLGWEDRRDHLCPPRGMLEAFRGYREVLAHPCTPAILLMALASYGAFMALRGLWLGPLLMTQFGWNVLLVGHAALAVSIAGAVCAPLAGRFDPGDRRRSLWIALGSLLMAVAIGLAAYHPSAWLVVLLSVLVGALSAVVVLQYAEVRDAYPPELIGRALALFTMVLFAGAAGVQWVSGFAAAAATRFGYSPPSAALFCVAILLVVVACGYLLLARPGRRIRSDMPPAK